MLTKQAISTAFQSFLLDAFSNAFALEKWWKKIDIQEGFWDLCPFHLYTRKYWIKPTRRYRR